MQCLRRNWANGASSLSGVHWLGHRPTFLSMLSSQINQIDSTFSAVTDVSRILFILVHHQKFCHHKYVCTLRGYRPKSNNLFIRSGTRSDIQAFLVRDEEVIHSWYYTTIRNCQIQTNTNTNRDITLRPSQSNKKLSNTNKYKLWYYIEANAQQ